MDRQPVQLMFADAFPSREDAIGRERQIKEWSRVKKEALIHGNWDRLRKLAKTRGSTS